MTQQLGFFEVEGGSGAAVSGLQYHPNFFGTEECSNLLAYIDEQPWLADLKRRVQHFGYKYDYKARRVTEDQHLGELPKFIDEIAERLVRSGAFEQRPDQAIVNEYQPGQGISPHVDCVPCFGNRIATLSLGSVCEMEFREPATRRTEYLILDVGSLLVLAGDARYKWTHAIRPRLSDRGIPRQRRVSLTFRAVLLER